jgi:hypothetical protein
MERGERVEREPRRNEGWAKIASSASGPAGWLRLIVQPIEGLALGAQSLGSSGS